MGIIPRLDPPKRKCLISSWRYLPRISPQCMLTRACQFLVQYISYSGFYEKIISEGGAVHGTSRGGVRALYPKVYTPGLHLRCCEPNLLMLHPNRYTYTSEKPPSPPYSPSIPPNLVRLYVRSVYGWKWCWTLKRFTRYGASSMYPPTPLACSSALFSIQRLSILFWDFARKHRMWVRAQQF